VDETNKDSRGSIAIGKKADLVLLNANPGDNIQNLTKINRVINKGQVIGPEALVQQQVNAFNAGDIEAFLTPYSDSIELYNFPGTLWIKGKELMRQQYGSIFTQFPNLHCEIKGRIVKGNFVVDHESVSGTGQSETMEAIAIYEIKDEKIIKAYFVR
jgi:hypothetical protein